jgi:hypothetical protein
VIVPITKTLPSTGALISSCMPCHANVQSSSRPTRPGRSLRSARAHVV